MITTNVMSAGIELFAAIGMLLLEECRLKWRLGLTVRCGSEVRLTFLTDFIAAFTGACRVLLND
jgi:hypothetical protein